MQNLTIEQKLAMVHRMKHTTAEDLKKQDKEEKLPFFTCFMLRMTFCVFFAGAIYILGSGNGELMETLYSLFTSQSPINLIDFFAPIKYTFMGF